MYLQSIPCAAGNPVQVQGGLGCSGLCCGGGCGLGLFDSGFDVSQWGLAEWGLALVGAYVLGSVFFTTKRAATYVAGAPRRSRLRKAAGLEKRAAALRGRRRAALQKGGVI